MQQIQKVLAAGATGYLGSYVVQEFKKRGSQSLADYFNELNSAPSKL